ncbi:MAG: cold shock domain-containing protein [Bacteroidales bacterium]|nr:cold shock domain-containing protein [Bacteroidales bacterium]
MGRSQETFNKKEVRKKKEKKRKEKEQKRLARKDSESKGSMDDMIAYVDEYGNISSSPPDPAKKDKIKAEDIEVSIPARDSDYNGSNERTGVLTFFNDSKGFGFIRDSQYKESIFVHMNNFLDDIREGDKVTFTLEKGPKGPSAVQVKLSK